MEQGVLVVTLQSKSWVWGHSLGLYSKPLAQTRGNYELTIHGEKINYFKYHAEADQMERYVIAEYFSDEVFRAIKSGLEPKYASPPFNVCIGPPENRNTGHSLPNYVCQKLVKKLNWMKNGFDSVKKTRSGEVMKKVPREERSSKLNGLYTIDSSRLPEGVFGILIIDDVFETGSTVEAVCDALEMEFPSIPRFVVALSHLHATKRSIN